MYFFGAIDINIFELSIQHGNTVRTMVWCYSHVLGSTAWQAWGPTPVRVDDRQAYFSTKFSPLSKWEKNNIKGDFCSLVSIPEWHTFHSRHTPGVEYTLYIPFHGVECMQQHALHSREWVCLVTLQTHSSVWIFPLKKVQWVKCC